eukprot:359190-Prymnesium_polylepis.1
MRHTAVVHRGRVGEGAAVKVGRAGKYVYDATVDCVRVDAEHAAAAARRRVDEGGVLEGGVSLQEADNGAVPGERADKCAVGDRRIAFAADTHGAAFIALGVAVDEHEPMQLEVAAEVNIEASREAPGIDRGALAV